MRTRIVLGIFICLFVLVLLVAPAQAQQWGADKTLRVTIPFNFYIGDTQFAAGDYMLKHNVNGGFKMVGMSGDGMPEVPINHLELKTASPRSELIFLRQGDKYILHQVRLADSKEVHDIRHDSNIPDVEVVVQE